MGKGLRVMLMNAGIAEPVAVDLAAGVPCAAIDIDRLAAAGGVEGGDDFSDMGLLRADAPAE